MGQGGPGTNSVAYELCDADHSAANPRHQPPPNSRCQLFFQRDPIFIDNVGEATLPVTTFRPQFADGSLVLFPRISRQFAVLVFDNHYPDHSWILISSLGKDLTNAMEFLKERC